MCGIGSWTSRFFIYVYDPYKMKLMQQFKPGDYEKFMIFSEKLLVVRCENSFDVGKIMFNARAHFDSHGNVNKQNVR